MLNKFSDEIAQLKKEIEPRAEWIEASRGFLMQQISSETGEPATVSPINYVSAFVEMFRYRVAQPAVLMLAVLVTFLTSSLVINAAYYSLPGDGLYRMKIALEKTHVAMVASDERKVELKIEFAQKRIEEFDKIVRQPEGNPEVKQKKIAAVVKEFKNNVVSVSQDINKIKVEAGKPEQVKETIDKSMQIALTVSLKTEELAKSLDEKAEALETQPTAESAALVSEVTEAIQSAQSVSETAKQIVDDATAETADVEDAQDGAVDGAKVEAQTAESNSPEDSDEPKQPESGSAATSTEEAQE